MKNLLLLFLFGTSSVALAQVTPPDTTRRSADSTVVSPAQSATVGIPADTNQRPQPTAPTPKRPAQSGNVGGFGQAPAPVNIPGTDTDNGPRGSAKITGIVADSVTGKPVEFASIALIDPATKKPLDGAAADDKGKFTVSRVVVGQFNLLISFVGYKTRTVTNVKIERRGQDLNLGTITLTPDVRTLNEVNVTGVASLVEEKVDRLVYNAEKDITVKGGDATDVMRKVPLLSVDLDGNVSLRGSSNVRVLINNKPSTIVASSVADALKQIPADMIKTVEVITSPSAKYDAEGSAGIINIVTKKTTLKGATLNVDVGGGNRGSNLGLNGSLRTGKMGFNLGGFGRANYNIKGEFENTQTTKNASGNNTVTRQTASTLNQFAFGQYNLGWDYDINKYNNLTASVRFGVRNGNNLQDNLLTLTTLPTGMLTRGLRNVDTKDNSNTVDANLDYNRTFAKPQQEFSISAQFSRNNRVNNFVADILDPANSSTLLSRQRNENPSFNQESTIQIDYQTPLSKTQLIEFGGKGILRRVNSDFKYYFTPTETAPEQTDPTRQANTLDYEQDIAASYLSYTVSTKNKYTIKAGARYEYTFINADFKTESSTNQSTTIPDYSNLVPSINISKSLKGGKTLKLAYNRRIQRPGIQFLNPNVNAANPLNITQGNVSLRPELTDNFEFSSSAYIKAVYINATAFVRSSNNAITSVRSGTSIQTGFDPANPIFQQGIYTTYLNIGTENAYGMNLFGNATLFSKWQIGGGFDLIYSQLKGLETGLAGASQPRTNSGVVLSGRVFTSLTLKNGWGVQGFGFARGRQVQLQGYQGSFAFYSLGMKKDFKNKRGSIGLSGENFFNFPFRITSESSAPTFSQNSLASLYNSGIRMNFSYRFGKISFEEPTRKKGKSVNNDDVKGEGDGGGGQPQPAAGGRPR
jgi:outer membrane receptor protein involved in Fe transport